MNFDNELKEIDGELDKLKE